MKARHGCLSGFLVFSSLFTARAQLTDPLDIWTSIDARIGARGMAYRDGRLVAVGTSTNILTSSNGVDWVAIPITSPIYGLLSVTAGAGQFVAAGSGPAGPVILTSSDGLEWTNRSISPPQPSGELWGVTYGGGSFVAVGFAATALGAAIAVTSTNGIDWESFRLPINTTPRCVEYGNGVYVSGGGPIGMVSTNGRDWAPLTSVIGASGVAFGAGKFVAASSTNGYTSSNGVDWTQMRLPGNSISQTYYTARYANGLFLASGLADTPRGLLITSTDGTSWSSHRFGPTSPIIVIRDIIQVDGIFYLADQEDKIWRSGRMLPASQPGFTGITHANGQTDLSLSAEPGFHYRLECTDHLSSPQWIPCGDRLFAASQSLTATDSQATVPARFYRIRTD